MKNKFTYDVCIIGGAGRAGLPLSICFAKEGKKVAILDISEATIGQIQKGIMPFKEEGAEAILREVVKSGNLKAGTDPQVISESENIVLIIGTPLSEHLYPDVQGFFKVIESYKSYFREGQLFVLRSTIAPGTTEKVKRLFEKNHLALDLAFCPERIAEGYAIREIYELPQIISSYAPEGFRRARELFSNFTKEIVELSPEEAELAKLFCNSWRYMRFAISNQYYMIANNQGLDFYRIYQAITHQYPRMKDLPRAGFTAGPCLFKDTMQLASHAENNLFIGHAAMLVNEGMPAYLLSCLKKEYDLSRVKIGILGMAFKAESDDSRESLAFKLYNILEKEALQVGITDPYLRDSRIRPVEELVSNADILIIGAPHQVYKELNLQGKKVIDIWNFYGKGGLVP